jgi:hypothetical protein
MVAIGEDIVSKVMRFGRKRMRPSVAREILTWHFSNAQKQYVSHLLEKNQEGMITPEELEELRSCVLLGEMIDLLQAQAELALKKRRKRQAA